MKKPNSVGYFSSYDRGLACLLDMWPEVIKEIPEATLDIYYGWDIFDKVNAKNPELMRWRFTMTQKIKSTPNVTEHGRVSHTELAKAMKEIKVWAYPTEFTEIHCITALKAQEAGCIPVTTGCYALEETVQDNTYTVKCEDIYTNKEKQQEFITKLIEALKSDHNTEPITGVDWSDVAQVWDKVFR